MVLWDQRYGLPEASSALEGVQWSSRAFLMERKATVAASDDRFGRSDEEVNDSGE